jgi:exopolysaccharide production protein ExoY
MTYMSNQAFFVPSPPAGVPSAKIWDERFIRVTDIVIALAVLIFLAPLMLIVAALVYVTNPGPVVFAHARLGRYGQQFRCFKFRSMAVDAEARLSELLQNDPAARREWDRDHKLKNDPRITPIGNFLRKSSLDELPQLFNVLTGEMSLVGPRPIVIGEVARYGRYFQQYCSVRPGITGLWQISGRNDVTYRRRVAMDVTYARAQSYRLNMRILIGTVPSVLLARGSY